MNDEDNRLAWYSFWHESKGNNNWPLTMLCNQGDAELGICWSIEVKSILQIGTRKAWKSFAVQQVAKHPRLAALDFRYKENDGSWFLPISIDASILGDAFADDAMEDVLSPLVERYVQRLKEAVPEFDAIISEARRYKNK